MELGCATALAVHLHAVLSEKLEPFIKARRRLVVWRIWAQCPKIWARDVIFRKIPLVVGCIGFVVSSL